MSLAAQALRWAAGGRLVLDGVSLEAVPGGLLGLLGPNGSGKSSLLRLLAGLRRPDGGLATLEGRDIAHHRRAALARRIAVVEQQVATEVPVTVLDIVRLGRTPHRGPLSAWSAEDEAAVREALRQTGLEGLAPRLWHSLSGGERQRAQIARALAQQPELLLLDEPTNHLDIRHQLEILALLRRLRRTSILALHDLNLAAQFCDRLVLLQDGRVRCAGPPEAVLTPATLRAVYGVEAEVVLAHPGARPQIRFLPPAEAAEGAAGRPLPLLATAGA
ncbi:ABC transporter ATP-binding protein [Pseudoroseomonas cervicalis]|uniref:ABC transporter ATP-binding protein n=1 Tax=Teichococcus cervicalis TaxID=204525 RepID=UPI0022F1915D|nr:ABC transporter ATP-binding protein [Pseudoroseomonas cervicalis]WBV44378.1 ABC transporter ATP-binding protein [Pseudoroseomonas cervicalis]